MTGSGSSTPVIWTARHARLARAISDCGWGEFRRQLEYKCERAGREFVVIDRWYPSSKTCSTCGHLLSKLKLSTRHWTCPACRTLHDRDVNAAKNILAARP
ncbi:MAG: RNA-guided endonuclease TnpB family protein [Umezawaea sp.]